MNLLAMLGSSDIGDPGGTRTVYAIIAVLIVMGIALIVLALWLRRTTRPDPELLGPLEVMGDRAWRDGDPDWQRQRLDEVRPEDAYPLERPTAPPDLVGASVDGPAGSGDADEHADHTQGDAEPADVGHADAEPADAEPAATPEREPMPEPERATSDTSQHQSQREVDVDDEVDAESEGEVEGGVTRVNAGQHTPSGLERPDDDHFDDVFEHDIDPEVLERARAELDAELREARDDT